MDLTNRRSCRRGNSPAGNQLATLGCPLGQQNTRQTQMQSRRGLTRRLAKTTAGETGASDPVANGTRLTRRTEGGEASRRHRTQALQGVGLTTSPWRAWLHDAPPAFGGWQISCLTCELELVPKAPYSSQDIQMCGGNSQADGKTGHAEGRSRLLDPRT